MRLRLTTALALLAIAFASSVPVLPGASSAAALPTTAVAKERAKKKAAARKRALARKRREARRRAAERERERRRREQQAAAAARSPRPPSTPAPTSSTPAPQAPAPATPSSSTAPPATETTSIAAPRLFAPTSVWNAALSADVPLDPRSGLFTSALGREVRNEVTANTGPWINTNSYSVPVYTVGPDTPTVEVTLDAWDPALQRDFAAVPIPPGARAAAGTDGTLTVYQPSTDTLWEFWVARVAADGWHARWGGKMTHVSHNPGYFPNPYGGSGTSLSLLGGLMTIDELKTGRIDHALALGIPNTAASTFTWPAQRGDGTSTGVDAIPEGTHFRIDPNVDLTQLGLTPTGLAMARAAQRYGIVIRDTAGVVVFYAEDPVTTGSYPYGSIFGGQYPNQVLRNFPWTHLQVVAPGN